MKRISRLLSRPPARSSWWVPLGLVALFASGIAIAAQLDPTKHQLPLLRIESSTEGTLRPGDYREITARGLDKQRYYRASVDARGRIAEVYKEDGKPHVIDSAARSWINEVARLSVPAPPSPPLPPPPPSAASPASPPSPPSPLEAGGPSAPPAPPMPPPPPSVADSADFKAILRLVAADSSVGKRIGNPIAVMPDSIDGEMRRYGSNDENGNASLSFMLSGPHGLAQIVVFATRAHGSWAITTLDVQPLAG